MRQIRAGYQPKRVHKHVHILVSIHIHKQKHMYTSMNTCTQILTYIHMYVTQATDSFGVANKNGGSIRPEIYIYIYIYI